MTELKLRWKQHKLYSAAEAGVRTKFPDNLSPTWRERFNCKEGKPRAEE